MAHEVAQEIVGPSEAQLARLFAEPKALISVSDKVDIGNFAGGLAELGIGTVSTGGTATAIAGAGVEVIPVEKVTGVPELFDGRVKTLHPRVHGGILADTSRAGHVSTLLKRRMPYFSVVRTDLYPFERTLATPGVTKDQINEQIDIGGSALMRAAAKAHRIVVVSRHQHRSVLEWIQDGKPNEEDFLDELAAEAFAESADYDMGIAKWKGGRNIIGFLGRRHSDFKYGENPWQEEASLYTKKRVEGVDIDPFDVDQFTFLEGVDGRTKMEKSWVGGTDMDRSLQVITHIAAAFGRNFDELPHSAVAVKHGNPCGAAIAETLHEAAKRTIEGNTLSIHGGVMMLNGIVDEQIANTLLWHANDDSKPRLLDGVVAAGFTDEARKILRREKLRLIMNPALEELDESSLATHDRYRQVRGGFQQQPNYTFVHDLDAPYMEYVGEWTEQQKRDAMFAAAVGGTSSNSNALTGVKEGMLIGNGVGQQDRVGAGILSLLRTSIEVPEIEIVDGEVVVTARLDRRKLAGATMYSDSFFPFADGIQVHAKVGIGAILTSWNVQRHKDLLMEEAAANGVNVAMAPDGLTRGFGNH